MNSSGSDHDARAAVVSAFLLHRPPYACRSVAGGASGDRPTGPVTARQMPNLTADDEKKTGWQHLITCTNQPSNRGGGTARRGRSRCAPGHHHPGRSRKANRQHARYRAPARSVTRSSRTPNLEASISSAPNASSGSTSSFHVSHRPGQPAHPFPRLITNW